MAAASRLEILKQRQAELETALGYLEHPGWKLIEGQVRRWSAEQDVLLHDVTKTPGEREAALQQWLAYRRLLTLKTFLLQQQQQVQRDLHKETTPLPERVMERVMTFIR